MIRKQFSQVILLLLLLSVMGAVYLPIRRAMVDQLENLKSNIIGNWEKRYALQVKYRSASPTIINSLRVRDFSLSSAEKMNFSFNADRISLFYGLRLFSRNERKLNLRRVIIKRGILYINIPESGDGISAGVGGDTPERVKELISEYFPSAVVELRDVNVRAVYGGGIYNWNIHLLRLETEDETISLSHKGTFHGNRGISFDADARGAMSTSLDQLNLSAGLADFESPYIGFDRLDFQIGLNNEEVRISKVSDKFPIDVSVSRTADVWNVRYQSEDFVPSRLFRTGSQWKTYDQWLGLSLDGSLEATIDRATGIPRYSTSITLRGNNDSIKQYLGGYSSLGLDLEGEGWDINSRSISLDSPRGDLNFRGVLHLPEREGEGVLSGNNILLAEGISLDSLIRLKMEDREFRINTESLLINGRDNGALSLSGETPWENDSILANAVYRGPLAEEIGIDIFADYGDGFDVKAWYEIVSLDIGKLGETLLGTDMGGAAALVGDAVLESTGFLEAGGSGANIMVDNLRLSSPDFLFSAKGYGNGEKIVLSEILLEGESDRLEGSFTGSLGDMSSLMARLTLNGNPYDIKALWDRGGRLVTMTGSYGMAGELRYYGDDRVHISLSSREIPLLWRENEMGVTLGVTGLISPDDIKLNILDNRVTVKDSPYIHPAEITLSGNLSGGTLNINRLEWSDEFSHVKGNGRLLLPLTGLRQFNGWVTLESDREEKFKFLFYKEGPHYNGYGDIENFMAQRVKAVDREGTLSAQLSFQDIPGRGVVTGNMEASLQDWGDLSCYVDMNEDRVLLTDIRGGRGETFFDSGIFTLDRNAGDMTLSLGMGGILAKKEWSSGLFVKGNAGNFLHPGRADFSGTIKTEEIRYNGDVVSPPLSFHGERRGNDFSLYNEDRSVWNSYYNGETGQIIVDTEKLLPLSFVLRGILKRDAMDLTVSRIRMDMAKANSFMPVDYASKQAMVKFDQGVLRGDLRFQGTPDSPRINGVMTIDPLQLNTAYSTKEKGVTRAAVDITENHIRMPYFEMAMGKTGAVGFRGDVLLDGWELEEFDFRFSLTGRNGGAVPIIYPIRGLALRGEAEGDISFYGTGSQYFIDGEVLMDSLVMSLAQTPKKPRIPRNERPDPWDLKVDLRFITGKDVSMVVPNEDFHIIKAQLDIDQELQYRLDNIPWEFSLTGELSVRLGEIAYFDKNFNLTEGRVTFEESQEGFDPLLDLTAETSVLYQGDDVTLVIDYEGSLFGDFDPQFSSIPSFSERDILAMLEPFQTGDNSSLALALGSYADRYTFSAPFEEGLKDVLNVDMVTIETGFLKNIIEDQLNSGQGVYTNESSQYNVARYLNDTYLNVGKYLGKDLFIAGGISVDYNERRTVMNGMGFDFNVTLEMETPFFNIGWTYLPDDLDSRSSSDGFISDSSITINFRL